MVKSGTDRAAKYGAKLDADVARLRVTAMKDTMTANAASSQAEIAGYQQSVREILDESPIISATLSQPFMAFAMECWGKKRRYSGAQLTAELAIVTAKWTSRLSGLTGAADKLTTIEALFAVA
jgi:hypothetical protein